MKLLSENRLGGLNLFIGSVIILITIFFEYRIGWIGIERPESEMQKFIHSNWSDLKLIWGWQMLGHSFFIIAYLLILKNASTIMRFAWSVLMLCGLMVVIAFGLTLGSYYPALEVYDSRPELFDTIRGGIGSLYKLGISGILVFAFVFFMETFCRNGRVKRIAGVVILSMVAISIILGIVTRLSLKVTGAAWFLFPLAIGYFYLRSTDIKK